MSGGRKDGGRRALTVKPLQACIAAYTGPLADEEKAQIASTKLETQLSVARAHWMLAYDVLYGEVRSMFAGRRTLAESFFVEWGKARSAKASGGTEVQAPA